MCVTHHVQPSAPTHLGNTASPLIPKPPCMVESACIRALVCTRAKMTANTPDHGSMGVCAQSRSQQFPAASLSLKPPGPTPTRSWANQLPCHVGLRRPFPPPRPDIRSDATAPRIWPLCRPIMRPVLQRARTGVAPHEPHASCECAARVGMWTMRAGPRRVRHTQSHMRHTR